jgi:hypothetical protein
MKCVEEQVLPEVLQFGEGNIHHFQELIDVI